jgi:glutamine amidotransferase
MIALLDTGIGNLFSIFNAVDAAGYDVEVVSSIDTIENYSHLIIPGVGSFQEAFQGNSINILKRSILHFADSGKPVLGICLGMQLLADWGEEGGGTSGLGLIPGKVLRIPESEDILLPHVGWNSIRFTNNHPILHGIKDGIDCYFVHSYYFDCSDIYIYGYSNYEVDFASIVGTNNIVGLQFHPEKSQANGLKMIENFCNWDGLC